MIVLHAGLCEGRLLIWGETSAAETPRGSARRGRKVDSYRIQTLVYDAGVKALVEALSTVGVDVKTAKPSVEPCVVWLPTDGIVPSASSTLIAEPFEPDADVTTTPWAVTAVAPPMEVPTDLLCACVDRQVLAPGVVVGRDLAFWAAALRFAGAITARQQYLPGIRQEGGAFHARWQPVFVGAEAQRLNSLSAAMPAACRAITNEPLEPPQVPAVQVLSEFVGIAVDHLVRSSLPKSAASTRAKADAFGSIHDQWLHALRTDDGVLVGPASELASFAAQVREWYRPISVSAASPFRMCFRMEEPEADDKPWFVRYLLQSINDPSLLIPVADAWNARGRKASILKDAGFNPREYVLSSLGQASGICIHVEDSLRNAAPEGYQVDTNGAFQFLTQTSLLLEQAGFGVMLPAWWSRKGTKLQLSARANVKSPKMAGGGFSLDDALEVDWQIALGNEAISYEELMALAKLKSPLVKLRGQWVQMSTDEIQAAIDFWKKSAQTSLTGREAIRMALGEISTPQGIRCVGLSATGWIGDLIAQVRGNAALEDVSVPDGFHGELRPYQHRGLSWLEFMRRWGLGACLADDMGLGKTVQTLALIRRNWEPGCKLPALLICPTSVVGNWQKEAAKFTPDLPVMIHHGIRRAKGEAFRRSAAEHAIVVSSYALLHRDIEALKEVEWAGVILDEAQNIKNPETLQARAVRSLKAGYRIALTGTPVENNVGDLWSLMDFLNPGFLGTQAEFKRSFFIPIQTSLDPEAADTLKRLTGPFILRRLKTDKSIISDLPEKMEMKVFCNLTKEQASLYAAVVKDVEEALESSKGIERKGLVLATLSKLKQVCNHPAQFLGDNSAVSNRSGKLARLSEMLEEIIEVGDRALVFTQFAEMGKILQKHLQETYGRDVLFLHGGVPKKQRDLMVERFQSDDNGPPVFILSLKAGGTGLNLTRANHVFHFDRWWNPAVENQATDRAFRIGQMKNVQVHKFLCVGTLEERIDEMIERKKEMAQNVVGAGEGWLTELSTTELRDIFTLRKEATGGA